MNDRLIDHQVAREVMGWRLQIVDIAPSEDPLVDHIWVDSDGNLACNDWEWLPSTEIGAAWDVVGKFRRYHPALSYDDETGRWTMRLRGKHQEVSGSSPSAPMAICIAALRAVGARVGNVDADA